MIESLKGTTVLIWMEPILHQSRSRTGACSVKSFAAMLREVQIWLIHCFPQVLSRVGLMREMP
jgi:hypothetical protein